MTEAVKSSGWKKPEKKREDTPSVSTEFHPSLSTFPVLSRWFQVFFFYQPSQHPLTWFSLLIGGHRVLTKASICAFLTVRLDLDLTTGTRPAGRLNAGAYRFNLWPRPCRLADSPPVPGQEVPQEINDGIFRFLLTSQFSNDAILHWRQSSPKFGQHESLTTSGLYKTTLAVRGFICSGW